MTTQPVLPFTTHKITAHRETIRQKLEAFFAANLGKKVSSRDLHFRFGSSVRTRISEINRDANSNLSINNEVDFVDGVECSVYWGEKRWISTL